ncbi:MAG TPA: type VI secretion system contractile sheath large subunit, partial [Acidobacteriota bacterium]|nr:type VI secretion system contractile sheath large subunit [Acidobacteriota bacterium]
MAEQDKKQQPQAAEAVQGEASLLDEILQATRLKPSDEGYSATRQGVQALIDELLKPERAEARVTQGLVDEMITNLDKKLSAQMDAILHHADFQKLESSWRSLKYLVDKTDFRENIKIEMLNVPKQALLDDFEDAPEIPKSGLYKMVYTREYGQFGGQPYGLMVGNYEFGPGSQDIRLLQNLASVATMAHAPFVAAAGSEFFGLDSFAGLPNLKDLKSIFEGPQYIKWQSFRESEDARYVGLTLPHFLLRLPYGQSTKPAKTFNYNEDVTGGDQSFLWGNAAFAFASRITDSFAKYRWCANIIGPQGGGAVEDMPVYQ